jgi:uncharacterized protein (TIGR00290 family)
MKIKKKAVFNWSGGKDSALALYKILQDEEYEIVSLMTCVNAETLNSSMHIIPIDLLQAQADSIGLPLHIIKLPKDDLTGYDREMERAVRHFIDSGVRHFAFGDIYLHDVKKYREEKLSPLGVEIVEPLWDMTTREVVDEFLKSGIRSKVIVTQADKLDESYLGRELTREFFDSLPDGVDLCGEEGEFHTFAYGGPIFKNEIKHRLSDPMKFSFDINMAEGGVKTFHYWHSKISVEA